MTEQFRQLAGSFEFEVGTESMRDASEPRPPAQTFYVVRLPHSCDEWVITWKSDPAEAVAQMEQFIAEAQAALAELRTLAG